MTARRAWFGAGCVLLLLGGGCVTPPRGMDARQNAPKLIIVLFGGGTRFGDSMGEPEHRYVPAMWRTMVPRGTLFTNMRVEGKVVHPNSAGSVVSGHWEWDDLDWTQPVRHPTVFEVFRRARRAPDTKAWAFAYASILARTGESTDPGYGAAYGANVMTPPTIARSTAEAMDARLRRGEASGRKSDLLVAAHECAQMARRESRLAIDGLKSAAARRFAQNYYEQWRKQGESSSHDEFLAEAAIHSMRQFAPEVMLVAFGEIDCAHYGSWSRYVEAIRRTDALTARIWEESERLPAYHNRTLMLVLPDHGRELEGEGKTGFVHHSDFYTRQGEDEGCRRVWMLALGRDVAEGRVIHKPLPITTVAATGLEFLGIPAPTGGAPSVLPMFRAVPAKYLYVY